MDIPYSLVNILTERSHFRIDFRNVQRFLWRLPRAVNRPRSTRVGVVLVAQYAILLPVSAACAVPLDEYFKGYAVCSCYSVVQ